MEKSNLKAATFAGGCFWCMQGPFDALEGVVSTTVGYTGGNTDNPDYEQVSTGKTGHAEAIQILFDPNKISYKELLEVFWRNIDPTTKNQQFEDYGTQYRTAIFYHDDQQRLLAEQSKELLAKSGNFDRPIVTEIVPATKFFPAEDYHQHYYIKNRLHYQRFSKASGREDYLEKKWGKISGELKANLKDLHCKTIKGEEDALSWEQENNLLTELSEWQIDTSSTIHKLKKTIKTETFMNAVDLLKEIALIAENEQHHPDLHLLYNQLSVELYTHKAKGLTENDFILAAKIDELLRKRNNIAR